MKSFVFGATLADIENYQKNHPGIVRIKSKTRGILNPALKETGYGEQGLGVSREVHQGELLEFVKDKLR